MVVPGGVVATTTVARASKLTMSDVCRCSACVQCKFAPSTVAMIPCGHLSFCDECGLRPFEPIVSCLLCRTPVASVCSPPLFFRDRPLVL